MPDFSFPEDELLLLEALLLRLPDALDPLLLLLELELPEPLLLPDELEALDDAEPDLELDDPLQKKQKDTN